jgi:hypothetical protein
MNGEGDEETAGMNKLKVSACSPTYEFHNYFFFNELLRFLSVLGLEFVGFFFFFFFFFFLRV